MKKLAIAMVLTGTVFLSACSGASTEEQLDEILETTFEKEAEYRNVQSELQSREQDEQEIFESIMALTKEQQAEVEEKSQEAIASADERLELLVTERESMQNAAEEFKQIDQLIEETEDGAVQADLEALRDQMDERFMKHGEFTDAYEALIERQKELYAMVAEEDMDLATLQEKTNEVNEQNELVQEAVTAFNEQTEQFNELKNETIEKMNADND
ncbi:YkyA family protein [Planococcus sp. SSTMD024]|uniref:YkyA family protein n=1 Tax=Planococcus sp. SSTMD024 TaxID=3242163 RepID=UPI00351E1843